MRKTSHLVCLLSLSLLLVSSQVFSGDSKIDFSLIDQSGEKFDMESIYGSVGLIFFGYTLCPDVCPIEMQHVSTALRRLGDKSSRVKGIFITLDPQHDTPEILKDYLDYFDAGLIGLTGSSEQIEGVAKQFKVTFSKKFRSDDRYTLDHTANLFVIDTHGRLNTIVPFGFPAAHIETLLRDLLDA